MSHLTGFRVNSNVSDFSNFIVYVSASVLLFYEIQGEGLDFGTLLIVIATVV